MELRLKIIPQRWQICGMCHCAGDCSECPERRRQEKRTCLDNGCQECTLKLFREGVISCEDESDRLEAWIHPVTTGRNFRHLKKYLIKKREYKHGENY
jgi:hypothetical protein